MERQIINQIQDLPLFAKELKRNHQQPTSDPSELVFTGSGDSFASSLFAHYLSGGRSWVEDPYELLLRPSQAENKIVLITSVSGRTRTNIQLARRLRKLAKRRIAVTANPASALASECDDVIQLSYRTQQPLTSGTVSFTASLLALASQIRRLPELNRLDEMETHAKNWAEHLRIARGQRVVFVGSGIGHALAAYGSFKIHEVLGRSADYEHTEQLGHSKLFGLHKTDTIICLRTAGDNKTEALFEALSKNGFYAQLLKSNARDPVLAGLEAAFSFQHLALIQARKRGLRECAFVADKAKLRLSSQLIY